MKRLLQLLCLACPLAATPLAPADQPKPELIPAPKQAQEIGPAPRQTPAVSPNGILQPPVAPFANLLQPPAPSLLPLTPAYPPPQPSVPPEFGRMSIWQAFAPDRTGKMRPVVVTTPHGAYYRLDHSPFPYTTTRYQEFMPWVVD